MKNSIAFILLSAALLTYGGECHAQFLKKLGESIEKVSKQVDEVLKTETTTSASTPADDSPKMTLSTPHKNLQVKVIGVARSGEGVVLEFTITNVGDNIKDYRLSAYGSGNAEAYDNLGNQCRIDILFGKSESWHGGTAGGSLPNNVPVKIRVLLSRFSSQATSFSQIRIGGEAWDHGMTDRPDGSFIFKNVPIEEKVEQEVVIPVKEEEKTQVTAISQIADNVAAVEEQPAPQDYTLSKDQMNGWNAEGLLGKVKSVKYSTGRQIFFNTVGNPVKIINGEYIRTRSYTTSNLTKNSDNLKITYEKNTRKIQDYDTMLNQCGFSELHTFDHLGRVAGKQLREECSGNYEEQYMYNGTADKFPSITKGSEYWESGDWAVTRTYQYTEFDNNGNWTKRKVSEVAISSDYDTEKKSTETKSYVETATYVYY